MMPKNAVRLIPLCAILLSACGGGGSGSNDADTTAPTVASTSPASNASDVAINTTVSITFSEAMDCATITTSSFTLKDAGNNAISGSVTCSGTGATFTPAANLAYTTVHTATVTTAVTDSAGNALAADHSWSFTTIGVRAIGGAVTGMNGTGLVLQLNGANDLTLDANGAFAFPAQPDGSDYAVTIQTQPTGTQTCTVSNDSGTLAGADVTDVAVTCSPWTKQFGAASADVHARGAARDAAGNLYVAGATTGGLHGNAQTGTTDYFLIKYDAYGNRLYTKQAGVAAAGAYVYAVATDASGNVYVAGETTGGLDANPLTGTLDAFLIKYDSAGNRLYTRQFGVAGVDTSARSVATDADGNVYIAGRTQGGLHGNPLIGLTDFFLTKYDSAGTRLYTRQLGVGGDNTRGFAVTVDGAGNVYVTGETDGNLDDNIKEGLVDLFLTKYDSAGTKLYTKQLGAASGFPQFTSGYAVATDADDNVYVGGATMGNLDGNTGSGAADLFFTKYDASGNKLYTRQMGVSGANTYGNSLAIDASGNVYLAGETLGALDGNALTGTGDLFLVKYDGVGNKLYTRHLGATDAETIGHSVVVADAIYVAGTTIGDLDGNTLTGSTDGVVVKYDASGVKQ